MKRKKEKSGKKTQKPDFMLAEHRRLFNEFKAQFLESVQKNDILRLFLEIK